MGKKIFLLLGLFLSFNLLAQTFVAGKDYQVLNPSNAQKNTAQKITVTEFFSFGCPWCARVEPQLNQWIQSQGAKIEFEKVPVVFHPEWIYFSRAYFTIQALGQASKLTPVLFNAVQVQKENLTNNEAMIKFLIAQGIDEKIAKSAFENSTTIEMEINRAQQLMAQYQINAIPAFVIANQYKTDLQMAGNPTRLFEILNYLVNK